MKDNINENLKADGSERQRNLPINYYLDKEEFYNEIVKFKKSAAKPEDRQASEKLGTMLMTLTEHVLKMPSFYRYQRELKEDMRSFALYKCMKGLQTFDVDMKNAKGLVFAYFTKATIFAYYTFLSQHYKQVNIVRDLKTQYLKQADFLDPRIKSEMLNQLDEETAKVDDAKTKAAKRREERARLRANKKL